MLIHLNPLHTLTSQFLKMHFKLSFHLHLGMQVFSFLHALRLAVTCDMQDASTVLFGNASFGAVTLFSFSLQLYVKQPVPVAARSKA